MDNIKEILEALVELEGNSGNREPIPTSSMDEIMDAYDEAKSSESWDD